jgi:hypothetical protein
MQDQMMMREMVRIAKQSLPATIRATGKRAQLYTLAQDVFIGRHRKRNGDSQLHVDRGAGVEGSSPERPPELRHCAPHRWREKEKFPVELNQGQLVK